MVPEHHSFCTERNIGDIIFKTTLFQLFDSCRSWRNKTLKNIHLENMLEFYVSELILIQISVSQMLALCGACQRIIT